MCFETLWRRGRKCYITPAFSGIPKQRGTKSELAAVTLPSRGPKSGRKCYITPAFSGVPNKGDKSKRAQKKAEMLHHPCILGGPKQRGQSKAGPTEGGNATSSLHSRGSPNKGGQNQNWLPKPCLLGGPQMGGNATSPCFLGDPQQRGQNQSTKKKQKNQNKKFPMVSLILPRVLQTAPTGVRTKTFRLQRHCFTH